MDTFRLVLGKSNDVFVPIVFRLVLGGPDHVLCMKGNFGKGPLSFFGLRTKDEEIVYVPLDQVLGTQLIKGMIVRTGTLADGPCVFQGLSS